METPYLKFVKDALRTLVDKQSARLGGAPDGALCITITRSTSKTYRSIGGRSGDTYLTYLIPEQPMEMEPYRLDLHIWPILELLSEQTGDPSYRQMALDMADGFAEHGFQPRSGLGYLGYESQFDVVRLEPVGVGGYPAPKFKPASDLPLDMLWAAAPQKMSRMFKSAYYALVTRPETMDYNRFCDVLDFDDQARQQVMKFNSNHVAFAQTGAILIHWWDMNFVRTGDAECLEWAQAMADKWAAVQHPQSGLLPHWFGSDSPNEPVMPPRPYANANDTVTGVELLLAAQELRKREEGRKLADQLTDVALRLLRGIARHGYDPKERIFPNWLRLEGGQAESALWYAFRTEKQREEMAKKDPIFKEVSVFIGQGFYRGAPWDLGVGNRIPYDLARAAWMTGDTELRERVAGFAPVIMEEARKLSSEFNEAGEWTYPASASYIKTMLLLYKMTGRGKYLDWAKELADMELRFLSQSLPSGRPEWWRMQFRDSLLEALLLLDAAD